MATRILNNTDLYYYANIPNSVLTVRGRLYVTINFYNDEQGIVTKEMDNPIFILSGEGGLPLPETKDKKYRFEEILLTNSYILPNEIIYIENYKNLLQIYFNGKLLSSEEYSIDDNTNIITLAENIFVEGGRIIVILQVPCNHSDSGVMAVYADAAGRVTNNLTIGDKIYNGSETVVLPPIPKAVEYIKQTLNSS